MAIDTSMYSNIQLPHPVDPIEMLSKFQGLQNLKQQGQLGAQQLQSGNLDLQQKQMELDDQQKFRQAWQSANGDPDKAFELAGKAGVGPKTMQAAQQALLATKAERAKLTSAELDNLSKKNDMLHALLDPVAQIQDPQAQATAWAQAQQEGLRNGILTPQEVQGHPYPGDPDKVRGYVAGLNTDKWITAQAAKDRAAAAQWQAATGRNRLELETPGILAANRTKLLQVAAQSFNATDQPSYDAWRQDNPEMAKMLPPAFNSMVPHQVQQLGMTADQRAQVDAENERAAEMHRYHIGEQSIARVNSEIAAGRLKEEQMVNGMKYGPGTAEYWTKQLQDNPDSIKEMPPELRSSVGKSFTAATGLPLPTPASTTTQTQESAARAALDNISFIRKALQNPEIQKQIGPIMGRLGNAEQSAGTAVGLSPEAERQAQELRTRMRYFVFQEGKAVLGGRLPQQLMGSLESSSASPKMDPAMLSGALDGAEANAQSIMDNADKQRFGGKMRSREMRGVAPQKSYTDADVQAAVSAHPGLTAQQADAAFKAKGWVKK